ncbi:MAG: family NAD(P)-dependent oxidoreductase [Segetibacter sp.]|jgi:short-subunit dehydrogenase|nr:family NAD(P)-dependent oxidoreductase [Segetibacter sp.]
MNVIITGATKGMGRAIAEQFAAAGYNIVACSRTEKDLQEMKDDFLARFPTISVTTKAVNIGDGEQIKGFGKWILDSQITPDVLVNNAGYFVPGTIHDEKDGTIEKMMEVNLYSAYHLTRTLLPAMMERKQGHIFNICSIAAFQPLPNVGSYGISKFALFGLTKHLREEMKPFGIKVTAVLPGATFSGSWEGSDIDPKRIMESNDVAKMVFAASQLSATAVVEDIILRPQLGDL